MELAILFIGAYHPIKYGHILLFDIELSFVDLELLAICFFLWLIVKFLIRITYMHKRKANRETNKKQVLNIENKEVLQKIVEEQLQTTNAEILNIPVSQRWNHIEREIDKSDNHFTIRLKVRYPMLKEDLIRLSCLIRIGMDSFKIIQDLGISKDYLRKKRQLLAKTMEIKNSKKNLEQFIMEF